MSQNQSSLPAENCPGEEQDLLPLEQVQITNHLPAEVRGECQRLIEELLRQVILNQNTEL